MTYDWKCLEFELNLDTMFLQILMAMKSQIEDETDHFKFAGYVEKLIYGN